MQESLETPVRDENGTPALGRVVALGAAAVVGATLLASARPAHAQSKPSLNFAAIPGTGDVKVLNYALALEALEADLYQQCVQRLTTGKNNGSSLGRDIAGLGLSTSDATVKYVSEFRTVEAQHRNFLNKALGDASIIGGGTNGILRSATFDFGIETKSRDDIVNLLYAVEGTGVQAYLGAIKYFATKTYLAVAGGIQATEARHTAAVAILANSLGITPIKVTAPLAGQTTTILGSSNTSGIDGTMEPDDVLAAVSGPNGYVVLPTSA